mmetsp:Transcript_486/g.1766  ORF Transcript_486/g.1766 Transcript_486/m.1766 type:complete len:360 (-) Transcript_486:134-1213(-)
MMAASPRLMKCSSSGFTSSRSANGTRIPFCAILAWKYSCCLDGSMLRSCLACLWAVWLPSPSRAKTRRSRAMDMVPASWPCSSKACFSSKSSSGSRAESASPMPGSCAGSVIQASSLRSFLVSEDVASASRSSSRLFWAARLLLSRDCISFLYLLSSPRSSSSAYSQDSDASGPSETKLLSEGSSPVGCAFPVRSCFSTASFSPPVQQSASLLKQSCKLFTQKKSDVSAPCCTATSSKVSLRSRISARSARRASSPSARCALESSFCICSCRLETACRSSTSLRLSTTSRCWTAVAMLAPASLAFSSCWTSKLYRVSQALWYSSSSAAASDAAASPFRTAVVSSANSRREPLSSLFCAP